MRVPSPEATAAPSPRQRQLLTLGHYLRTDAHPDVQSRSTSPRTSSTAARVALRRRVLHVIDYQRMDGLTLLPAAASERRAHADGSHLQPHADRSIRTLACDPKHTSVALPASSVARVRVRRGSRARPEHGVSHDAQLLIGDKVICEEPAGYPHQLDLGQAWKDLTECRSSRRGMGARR